MIDDTTDSVSAGRSAPANGIGAQLRTSAPEIDETNPKESPLNTGVSAENNDAPGGNRTHTSHNGTTDFKSKAGESQSVSGASVARGGSRSSARGAVRRVPGFTAHRDGWMRWYKGKTRFVCSRKLPPEEVARRWAEKRKSIDAGAVACRQFTYFIQAEAGGPIKIGRTDNTLRRLSAMQRCCPVQLQIIGIIEGDCEAKLHVQFMRHRLHGEWFEPTADLLSFIENSAKVIRPALAAAHRKPRGAKGGAGC